MNKKKFLFRSKNSKTRKVIISRLVKSEESLNIIILYLQLYIDNQNLKTILNW